jgi:hypothetical protein
MKLAALLFAAAGMLGAQTNPVGPAPWDGTKGNITVSTTYVAGWTHISVNSSDPTVKAFVVTVYLKSGVYVQNDAHPGSMIQIPLADLATKQPDRNEPAQSNFWCELGQILMVSVTEIHPGQNQWFSASAAQ